MENACISMMNDDDDKDDVDDDDDDHDDEFRNISNAHNVCSQTQSRSQPMILSTLTSKWSDLGGCSVDLLTVG